MSERIVGTLTEQEINRNKQLALRIKNIFEYTTKNYHSNFSTPTEFIYESPNIVPGNDGIMIRLISNINSLAYKDLRVPTDFSLPAYAFRELFLGNFNRNTDTPYGQLPACAIAADGEVYNFVNYFIVNAEGKGIRYEKVNKTKVKFSDAEKKGMRLLDFTPHENDSRHVPLGEKDYTKINGTLEFIETNGYSLRQE